MPDTTFIFPEDALIFKMNEIADALKSFAQQDGELTIDISNVEEADTSFIQLLLSFKRSCIEKEQPLSIIGNSVEVNKLLQLYRLEQELLNS